jgi:hypothetical protein
MVLLRLLPAEHGHSPMIGTPPALIIAALVGAKLYKE